MEKGSVWQQVIMFTLLMGLVMVLSACGTESSGGSGQESSDKGPEPINGMTPAQVVMKYELAFIQDDEKTMYSLSSTSKNKNKGHSDLQGPQNQKQLYSGYKLTEYKYDDDTYYYDLEFASSPDEELASHCRVVREKDGWKFDKSMYGWQIERAFAGKDMKPRVVKDTDDKPLKIK